jgi:fructose-specific phosphotransferase system IIA component
VCILDSGVSKHDALDRLVSCIAATGAISDTEAFRQAVKEREAVMSTGIGSGVAIPHVRIDAVKRPTVGIGISREGIDFGTLDNKPVNIIILFAMPTGSHKEYLGLLAQVMTVMKAPGFRDQLAGCSETSEVIGLVNRPE